MQSARYKQIWFMMVISMLSVVVSVFGSEEVAGDLWQHMRDGGLITQEQYQHVLKEGRLPGGTIVKDSPIPEKEQHDWQQLAEHQVISSKELASILFSGSVPHMSAAENKAFEELAPVYEPDRAKRLGYDLRRKHQKVDLIRLKHKETIRWNKEYAEALKKAKASDLPLRIEKEDGQISELFAWRYGQPLYFTTFNRIAAKTVASDDVRPGGSEPFALTGNGITIAMWDGGGAVTNHNEFSTNRVWWGADISNTTVTASHATGVAGTMAATGVDTNAQGMAYAAQVESYDWNFLIPEITACVISNENIHISNHSYGITCGWDNGRWINGRPLWLGDIRLSEEEDYKFGWYQIDAQAMDQFCYTEPYHLPVYAAGNNRGEYNYGGYNEWYYPGHYIQPYLPTNTLWYYSSTLRPNDGNPAGYDCITPNGVSKNILTVGAIQDLPNGYTNGMTVVLESYSGTGPTDDGRIKPDVVANGQKVHTTYGTETDSYDDESGTSFSAPSVSGSLALIQELHNRVFGPDAPMLSSTLKGIAIHTAHDIGLVGPDYTFGWGLFSTPGAAWSVSNNVAWDSLPHIKEVCLADGDEILFKLAATTNESLKVTIVWTDPAGPLQPWTLDPTNRVLVNDLDLRLISPDGTTNFPWVLDVLNPSVAATTGDNAIDNVEQVVVTPLSNSVYTVHITHKGSLSNGAQDVSILLSGNSATNAPEFVISDILTDDLTQLKWPGVVGALYEVESINDLTTTNWSNQGAISANQELMNWVDMDSTNQPVRFYRINRRK